MFTPEALLDCHERAHRNLIALLARCRALDGGGADRELGGFGYPTVRLQLHHAIAAEQYWIGVLRGRVEVAEDSPEFSTIAGLESYRDRVYAETEAYLRAVPVEELNVARARMTWGNRERMLVPAHVVMRTVTHLYHHQGQVLAMLRLLGKPGSGLDYPIL
jgi:uncharacterized damage-inducible protein DinB